MLQTLHRFMGIRIPIYGMNRGSVGFLMNEYREEELPERLARAKVNMIHPLRMQAVFADGTRHECAGDQRGASVPPAAIRRRGCGSRWTGWCGWRS